MVLPNNSGEVLVAIRILIEIVLIYVNISGFVVVKNNDSMIDGRQVPHPLLSC